ncbi:class I SAM-dependent methyltransferase [Acinetobacter higginsii]|uniref:class I SAM-dependent methyltransferase n=1 Tax=Acinetobacter higginsii TaxID=70347 RepID=UPI001F4BB33B|nr:class I SAM-dependent methyltransferase [Acinetobacter higginsii]MCH7294894.1 class I SAM-dependent methyltransferase [Acinetobacter higginsii]
MSQIFAELTQDQPHRPILEYALQYVDSSLPRVVIDCGCGAGNEAAFLLKHDYLVYAFDPSKAAQQACQHRFKNHPKFFFSNHIFEEYSYPSASIIVALFSLFFCAPSQIDHVLAKMKHALPQGGILLIQLLGQDDPWLLKQSQTMKGFNRQQIEQLFIEDYEVLLNQETRTEHPNAYGKMKFWNFHTLILKKI